MKEQLIELLGLAKDAAEEAVIAEVGKLVKSGKATAALSALERKIAAKIAQSGGALNREQALAAIEAQEVNDKANKK